MKHEIESKIGYQNNLITMQKLKKGTFPNPTTYSKMDYLSNLSVASTKESFDLENLPKNSILNLATQINNKQNDYDLNNTMDLESCTEECTVIEKDQMCYNKYNFTAVNQSSSIFQDQKNMSLFKRTEEQPRKLMNGTAGQTYVTRTLEPRVTEVVSTLTPVTSAALTQAMTELSKTTRLSNVDPFIETGPEKRIIDIDSGRINTMITNGQSSVSTLIIDSLPSLIQKRALPILEVYELFEAKCITLNLLNKLQASTIKYNFQLLLTHILPVINTDLRYQHSESVAAVLLMFAWETSKLPIKNFLKTIDSCTKKDLGRVGTIRKCKAFTLVKKLKSDIPLVEAQ